ncbi:hypothetical protein D3Z52_13770 [Clostridiaceae bacterium]|nr:hypothetical protein [Clostridiaceae bacterium]NBI83619.1 hypothetical protein [Clostridiaceae bacterium]RKJ76060.1 hypothetical protein D7X33_15525 [Butyricicoccus sp. 1XD8-22]
MGIRAGVATDSLGFTIFAAERHTSIIITAAGGKFNLFGGNSAENLILMRWFGLRAHSGGQTKVLPRGGAGRRMDGKKEVFGNGVKEAPKFWKPQPCSTYLIIVPL